ncbi:iron complex transport system substrate-binding protein [Roseovarius sp. MBR-78]|uniref:ABC transporter substrate-binding protein n=1 Tax=Roseovarius sp. MBR-78 TaxID=3156460 RepID=UPI0033929490
MTRAHADPVPARVVSINLCTDQLAMMLAAPGQLVSVSRLAADPHSSAMAREARAFPANQGRAEEVYLLRPDLVLAGAYSDPATVGMLRRIGLRVEQFDTARSLDDTRARIAQMAGVLGREAAGRALIARFDARLAALRRQGPSHSAALYHPNGYSLGGGTLADDILRAAGFDNIARDLGLRGGGTLALERLVMAAPELLIRAEPLPGASRSEAVMAHPALERLSAGTAGLRITSPDWICGTPHVLGAVETLVRAREGLE